MKDRSDDQSLHELLLRNYISLHIHARLYLYMYACVCVCVCASVYVIYIQWRLKIKNQYKRDVIGYMVICVNLLKFSIR